MTRSGARRGPKELCAGAILLGLVHSYTGCSQHTELSAADLVRLTQEAYSAAETYRDRGVATTVLVTRPGSPEVSISLRFETIFQRSRGFRLSYWSAEPGSGRTILAAGTASQSWVEGAQIPAAEGSLADALRGAMGPSHSVSAIAASLLTMEEAPADGLLSLSRLERLPDQQHRGRRAHVVRGNWHRYSVTLWVDAERFLILRLDLSATDVGPQFEGTVEQSIVFEPSVGETISPQELQLSFRGAGG